MSFAVAGLRVRGIEIADPGVVAKTWPAFWEMLSGIAQSIA
jgi:3-phosphoshikimate 1-carboxyvinyltransferase